jgi:hypothetical protein
MSGIIINPYRYVLSEPTILVNHSATAVGVEGLPNLGYAGDSFVAPSSFTLTSASLWLSKAGSPTHDLAVQIRSHGSSVPGTVLATSDSVSATTLSTTSGAISFSNLSLSLTSGSRYWVIILINGGTPVSDWTNYIKLDYNEVQEYPGFSMTQKSETGSTWTAVGNVTVRKSIYGY